MDREQYASQLAKEMRQKGIKFTKPDAAKFISALTKSMAEGLSRDRKLIISNFGTFSVNKYSAKIIQSPRGDNKKFFMPPTDVVKWHPSGKLRERGKSEEVSEDEYEDIKNTLRQETELNPIRTEETTADSQEELIVEKAIKSNEVVVNVFRRKDHLSDATSPLSKLTRSLIREMITSGSMRVEIKPQKTLFEIIYFSSDLEIGKKILPKDSGQIVINKILSLSNKDSNLILISPEERATISSSLTPFGKMLTIERV